MTHIVIDFRDWVEDTVMDAWAEGQIGCLVAEDDDVGRASEPEMTQQISFFNMLALFHHIIKAGNLHHSYLNYSYVSDFGVIGLYYVNLTSRNH